MRPRAARRAHGLVQTAAACTCPSWSLRGARRQAFLIPLEMTSLPFGYLVKNVNVVSGVAGTPCGRGHLVLCLVTSCEHVALWLCVTSSRPFLKCLVQSLAAAAVIVNVRC